MTTIFCLAILYVAVKTCCNIFSLLSKDHDGLILASRQHSSNVTRVCQISLVQFYVYIGMYPFLQNNCSLASKAKKRNATTNSTLLVTCFWDSRQSTSFLTAIVDVPVKLVRLSHRVFFAMESSEQSALVFTCD